MNTSQPMPGQSKDQAPADNAIKPPAITLPKGGGAVRGIGEKFAAHPVTGTGSMSVPIVTSPGRSGLGPQLSLSYNSGADNFDYGEHDTNVLKPNDVGAWPYRSDAFSTYRSGFKVPTTRLCQRVLTPDLRSSKMNWMRHHTFMRWLVALLVGSSAIAGSELLAGPVVASCPAPSRHDVRFPTMASA